MSDTNHSHDSSDVDESISSESSLNSCDSIEIDLNEEIDDAVTDWRFEPTGTISDQADDSSTPDVVCEVNTQGRLGITPMEW